MEDEAFKERLDIMREGLFYGYKTEKLDKQIAKKLFGGVFLPDSTFSYSLQNFL